MQQRKCIVVNGALSTMEAGEGGGVCVLCLCALCVPLIILPPPLPNNFFFQFFRI